MTNRAMQTCGADGQERQQAGGAGHTYGQDHAYDHHDHPTSDPTSGRRDLTIVAGLDLLDFMAELFGGLLFGSVAHVSDAVHMLFDSGRTSSTLSLRSSRPESTSRPMVVRVPSLRTTRCIPEWRVRGPDGSFHLVRIVPASVNNVAIGTGSTLAIAVGGLAINGLSVLVLEGEALSLNERGAFYHLLGDADGSVAVIVAVLTVEDTGFRMFDPMAATLVPALLLWSAEKILRGSSAIVLHRSPIDGADPRRAVDEIEGVTADEDLHTWQVCSELTVATVHVRTEADSVSEKDRVTARVHGVLAGFGMNQATVESCPAGNAIHPDAHRH